MLRLYLAHVRPLLEYASQVWDPHHVGLKDSLERVQKFGLRVSFKLWDADYSTLLERAGVPSLEARRRIAKICYLASLLHRAVHHPAALPECRVMDCRLRSYATDILVQPFAKSNQYKFSFFPDVIKLWNGLPASIRASPSALSLKRKLNQHFAAFTAF